MMKMQSSLQELNSKFKIAILDKWNDVIHLSSLILPLSSFLFHLSSFIFYLLFFNLKNTNNYVKHYRKSKELHRSRT